MKIEREVIAQLLAQAEEAPTKTYLLHGLERLVPTSGEG